MFRGRCTGGVRYLEIDTAKPYSKIGLGTWQFGSTEWGYGGDYADDEAKRLVTRALELGITVFDTAELYGMGRSERILGAALEAAHADPARTVVATKIFPLFPVAPVVVWRGVASAARLRSRLGGGRRIDLYQVHLANPVVRDGTTMRGMRALQAAGVVDEVGVSNYPLGRWRAAETALGSRVLSNQVQYSLVARGPERDLLPFAAADRRVVIAWSPLAQGLLSARYDAGHRPTNRIRSLNPLFLPANLDRAAPLLAALWEVADAHDATPAQVALAWTIRHPAVVAIPGASSVAQLESNAAAAELALADAEVAALCAASEQFTPVTGLAAAPSIARQVLRP